jgi:hypothetical protein
MKSSCVLRCLFSTEWWWYTVGKKNELFSENKKKKSQISTAHQFPLFSRSCSVMRRGRIIFLLAWRCRVRICPLCPTACFFSDAADVDFTKSAGFLRQLLFTASDGWLRSPQVTSWWLSYKHPDMSRPLVAENSTIVRNAVRLPSLCVSGRIHLPFRNRPVINPCPSGGSSLSRGLRGTSVVSRVEFHKDLSKPLSIVWRCTH